MKKNIIANYIGRFWGFVSVFLFVPLYIKILGVETYAIINFYTVLLTIMFVADAGLTATLSREIARTTDKKYLCNLLYTIERVYILICFLVALLVIIFSGTIARYWIKSDIIKAVDISHYIALMGICIALQLYNTLFNGGLMGLQKQVLANGIQIIYSLFRSGIVLLPLYFYPNLYIYFIWQIIINIIILLFTRYKLWQFIKTEISFRFDFSILKGVWRFALGMMTMSIIYSMNTQIDKLFVSKMLSLIDFGYYSLASILAQVPIILTLPIANAVLPKMTRLVGENKKEELTYLFHRYSFIIAAIATTVTMVIFCYTKELALIWIQNYEIAIHVSIISKVLIIGGLLMALQLMPYHLAIANGHTKTNVRLGTSSVLIIVPMLFFCIKLYGVIGAAFPWVLINFAAFVILGIVLVPKFLKSNFKIWILFDTMIPIVICLLLGSIFYFVLSFEITNKYLVVFISAFMSLVALSISLMVYNVFSPKYSIKDMNLFKKNGRD